MPSMMTLSNGNIFRTTGPLCGNSPVNSPHKGQWRGDFVVSNKGLSIKSWGWWFQTPSRPLWHHGNGFEWDRCVSNQCQILGLCSMGGDQNRALMKRKCHFDEDLVKTQFPVQEVNNISAKWRHFWYSYLQYFQIAKTRHRSDTFALDIDPTQKCRHRCLIDIDLMVFVIWESEAVLS